MIESSLPDEAQRPQEPFPVGGINQQTDAPAIVRQQWPFTVFAGAVHGGRLWTSTAAGFGPVGPGGPRKHVPRTSRASACYCRRRRRLLLGGCELEKRTKKEGRKEGKKRKTKNKQKGAMAESVAYLQARGIHRRAARVETRCKETLTPLPHISCACRCSIRRQSSSRLLHVFSSSALPLALACFVTIQQLQGPICDAEHNCPK